MLWQAITPLEARETLVQIRVANNPWVSQNEQRDFHDKTQREAYPFTEARSITWDDLAEMMGQRGSK